MFLKKILNGLKKISSVVFVSQHWVYANSWQRIRLVISSILNLIDTTAKLLGPLALAKSIEMVAESNKDANFYGIKLSSEMLLIVATSANTVHLVMPTIKKLVLYGIQEDFAKKLSQKIIDASQKQVITITDSKVGELLNECSKHLQCANFATTQLLSIATESIHPLFLDVALGVSFTFFRFDHNVGGILLAYIFISILINEMLSRFTQIHKRTQQIGISFSNYMKDVYEVLINTETIQIFNRQQLESHNLNATYDKYFKLNKRNSCYENFWVMQHLLASVVQFLAVYYVIDDGFQKLELDDIIFLINYAINIGGSVSLINQTFHAAMSAAESLSEADGFIKRAQTNHKSLPSTTQISHENIPLLAEDEDQDDLLHLNQLNMSNMIEINNNHKTAIEFKNVSFYYVPECPILNLISFKIPSGKKTGMVGISSAGKTTIFKLISRLIEPTNPEATIKIFGKNIRDISINRLRELISITKQFVEIFQENSLRYNILYGFADDNSLHQIKLSESTKAENEQVDTFSTTNKYDSKLSTVLSDMKLTDVMNKKECRGLSGGQQQRIGIARILARNSGVFNSRVLLLDEATSNLDSETEEHVQNSIKKHSEGTTIVMIAHRLSTIKDSDKILVIDKQDNTGAKVIEEGTHDQLLEKDGSYAHLWRLQIR